MKKANALARLNGRILHAYSRRTITSLRAALPLRLALPHLEPVLALNVAKEVDKDTLVIQCAAELAPEATLDREVVLQKLLQTTKEIDSRFLSNVGRFPVGIVVRYEEIAPVRTRRITLLYDAAAKILAAQESRRRLRDAIQASFSREDLSHLLYELFRLYAEEIRSLSRSVRLPMPLVPLRELIAQELLNVMLRVASPLAHEIAAVGFPAAPSAELRQPPATGLCD